MSGIFPNSGVPANQATNTVDVPTVGCESELFHSTNRCQPRFDPAAANAVMSEILNVTLCAGIPYDCTRLDNLCRAIEGLWGDQWTGCFTADIPSVSDVCGTVRQIVLVDDGECKTFATYSAAEAERHVGTFGLAQEDRLPPNTTGLIVPADFLVSGDAYELADLRDDYAAGTIDGALINNSKLTRAVFSQTCPQSLLFKTILSIDQPEDVAIAYGRRGRVGYRYRIDGGAWEYSNVGGVFSTGLPFNALQSQVTIDHASGSPVLLPAGLIEFETFYVRDGANPAVGVNANTYLTAPPVPSPRTIITVST